MLRDGVVKVGLHFREPLVLVVPASYALASQRRVALGDIERAGRPFLLVRWGPSMNPVLARIDLQTGPVVEVPIETVWVRQKAKGKRQKAKGASG